MTIGDNRDHFRVLLYSYYTTITGWGVLLRSNSPSWKETHTAARPVVAQARGGSENFSGVKGRLGL